MLVRILLSICPALHYSLEQLLIETRAHMVFDVYTIKKKTVQERTLEGKTETGSETEQP